MVSLAITSILLLGLSTFFASTFHNLFEAQNQAADTEKQFVVNEIIRDKFMTIQKLVSFDTEEVLIMNKQTKNQLPLSYIGSTDIDNQGTLEKRLVFKDVMIFNKIFHYEDGGDKYVYGDNGTIGDPTGSQLISLSGDSPIPLSGLKNFAGFAKIGDSYYIADPDNNRIIICDTSKSPSCKTGGDFNILNIDPNDPPDDIKLDHPTDIATNGGSTLFISDSGNNQIIMRTPAFYQVIADETTADLNFPTGLSYFENEDGSQQYLFVADTFNNKVKRINLTDNNSVTTIVGDGDNEDCDFSAKFCKLSLPTGLFAYKYKAEEEYELYIADSGNNRILRVRDPKPRHNVPAEPESLTIEFELTEPYAWDNIDFSDNFSGESLTSANLQLPNYDNGDHKINNDLVPTVAHDSGACTLTNDLHVESNLASLDPKPQHLIINNRAYKIVLLFGGQVDCLGDGTDFAYQIDVTPDLSGEVSDGDFVYVGAPTSPIKITVELADVELNQRGFQTIQIDTYSVGDLSTPAETDYVGLRAGDGILGTDEDLIEVLAGPKPISGFFTTFLDGSQQDLVSDLIFPTGVSNIYFANSGNEKIVNRANLTEITFTPIDPSQFTKFDYIGDFEIEPLSFVKYNSDTILEMEIKVTAEDGNGPIYQINSRIP